MIIGESKAYYIFTFGGEAPMDIHKVARRLLKQGVAYAAISPASGDVFMSPQYRELADLLRDGEKISSFKSATGKRERLKWLLCNPGIGLKMAARLRIRISSGVHDGDSESGGADSESGIEVIDEWRRHREALDRVVMGRQFSVAVQHEVERGLLRPSYLEREPYIRLKLRAGRVWLSGGVPSGRSQGHESTLEAHLMLHRSGVMQLVLSYALPQNIDADTYGMFSFGGSPAIDAVSLPEAVIDTDAGALGGAVSRGVEGKDESGSRLIKIEFSSSTSAAVVFVAYANSVTAVGKVSWEGEWFCYPAMFLAGIACCESENKFSRSHAEELALLFLRLDPRQGIRAEQLRTLMPENAALDSNSSFYFNASSMLEIEWKGPPGEFADHLNRLIIMESALLQYWQIRMLDQRISATQDKLSRVREVQKEAIFGLREYREAAISYGTAKEITEKLLSEWRADRFYARILEGLSQLQQLAATEESRLGAKRANTLAALVLIATLFFGIPAVGQTLQAIDEIPDGGFLGFLSAPLRFLAGMGPQGVWIGYLTMATATVICFVYFAVSGKIGRSRGRRFRPIGMRWPGGDLRTVRVSEIGDTGD
ncbi:hypothetical protein QNO07_16160 [Streptomyces sp. 549]|uniref:hypothetical protein n=1 Tax=Streptomyces sp. 549 TaxID=3049076 RepID=UPI0024C2A43E|nr:hypothetical protein [Streptomyces sp. 549]MDK1474938.1 hypothetical protein [Streptomyces sp. 549]